MQESRTRDEIEELSRQTASGMHDIVLPSIRRRRRPWVRRLAVAVFSFPLMLGLGFLACYAVLAQGPLEARFLSQRIALGIEQRIGSGVDVDVGRTVLERRGAGFGMHVLDVVMKDVNGREILRSPDAIISFNPLQLLKLSIMPEKIALRGMAMKAEITPDGDIVFKTAGSDEAAAPVSTAQLADVAAFVFAMGGPGSSGGLAAISIEDASLRIEDRRNGKLLSFENMRLAFEATPDGGLAARGSLRKERDLVPFSLTSRAVDGGRRLKFAFSDVGDHVVQALLGAKTAPFTLGAKLRGSIDASIGGDGKLRSFEAAASMGEGSVAIPTVAPSPFAVDRLSFLASWRAGSPREAGLRADFSGGGVAFVFDGPVVVPETDSQGWRWTAKGDGLTLGPTQPQDGIVTAEKAELDVTFDLMTRLMTVHRLSVEGPQTAISLSAKASVTDDGPALAISLAAGRMPLRTALRWWPSFISSESRAVLARTVQGGELLRLGLELEMPPSTFQSALRQEALPREAVQIEAAIENGILAIADGIPAFRGLAGQGRLDAHEAAGTFDRGFIDPGQGRAIQLAAGAFAIKRLDTWTPDASVRLKASGGLDSVAEYLRSPGFQRAHGVDIDPADVKGQFEGSVAVTLPLTEKLTTAQVRTEVQGRMTGVNIEKAIGKDRLENATLTVETDRQGIEIRGEGRWQGTPVTLTLENDSSDNSRSAVLTMTLDEAALKRRGFALQGQLQGPLPVTIRSFKNARDSGRANVEIDLTRAAIDGLVPGLQKAAGRAGKLTFEAIERSGGYSVQNIALEAGASAIRGQAEIAADGSFSSARFSLFRLSPGDNVRLDYDKTSAGAKVVIRGNNFDARPFLRTDPQPDGAPREGAREIDVDIKTTLLSGYGGEVITGADGRMVLRGPQLRQIALTGKLNGRAVSISGRGIGEASFPITVESSDAGALLRYVDLYGRMFGGDLSGQIVMSARGMSGYLITREFVLRNEPAIRRLVQEAQGEQGRAETDTRFTKMRVDFTRAGTETTVKDAVIFGPQLGLTFNGVFDRTRDRVSVSGTYVPAYGLNNAFAQIPIVGGLLGGGRNEGLLALTFGVSGRASQPTVTVNPLSAVAPGIFRRIFEFRNERSGGAAAPEQAPSPAMPN